MYESVDWSRRGAYKERKHGISPIVANDALEDPNRILIDPDYNSASGRGVRVIGYSTIAEEVITVIVLINDGTEHGVNGWRANAKDRLIYSADWEGEVDEQEED